MEVISEKMSVIGGFASLSYASDTQSDEATSLLTRMTQLGAKISNRVLFFQIFLPFFQRVEFVFQMQDFWGF